MANKLYMGIFNYKGEQGEDWVRAASEQQAYRLITARIGVAKGMTAYSIRQYFNGKAQSYSIREVKEDGRN